MNAQTSLPKQVVIEQVVADSSYYIGEWVLENSISIRLTDQSQVPDRNWLYDPVKGTILFRNTESFDWEGNRSVIVSFNFLPLRLKRVFNEFAVQPLDSTLLSNDTFLSVEGSNDRSSGRYDTDLQQSGSLSRGIIVGTNQDFALESGLDFQLTGKLTEDVSISAVLTDRSIPIQPDGTTQNLREFDRVFIQVNAPSTRVEMGDVDVSFQKSTFAKLNRRLQGASVYSEFSAGEGAAAASVVRGNFKSVQIDGLEGVQGPYRLTGNDNEEFVIILAGTEKVYINGVLADRGEDGEYIIDYGLGEITFTNNLLIKDETRIFVEYEFIDQNFNRTLIGAEGEARLFNDKVTFGATVIRQADSDNLLSQQVLTESDIDILRSVGDDISSARVPGAERVEGDDEVNVLYAEVDTTVNSQTFRIFKNTTEPEAVFRVRFTNVGEANGSYRRIGSDINGLLFEWVGPGLGEYEPFRNLPAPIRQQMAAFTGNYAVSKNAEIFGEWAVSDFDRNRFSSIDNDDNVDNAYIAGISLKEIQLGSGALSLEGLRRFSGSNFQFFERTRDVEFDRKWNLTTVGQSEELTNDFSAAYSFATNTKVIGEYGEIDRQGFSGRRQASRVLIESDKGFNLNYNQTWNSSTDDNLNTDGSWFTQLGTLSKRFNAGGGNNSFTPYIMFEQENRRQRNVATDSLRNQSLSFVDVISGVQYQSGKWLIDYSFGYRTEQRVFENELTKESEALQHGIRFNLNPSNYFNSENRVLVREKEFTEEFSSANTNKRSLLIRSNNSYKTPGENWRGSILYEANTQREALLQETYIEVGPEIGQFVWDDLNGDGVEQLDEFFPELTPNEGTYLRQFLPSDELFPVINLQTRFRNTIKPFGFLNDETGVNKFLSQITFNSRIDIAENSETSELADVYLLRLNTFRDPVNTIRGRIGIQKSVELFPDYDPVDIDLRYNQLRSLNRRSSELQKLFTEVFLINTGYSITSTLTGNTRLNSSVNESTSSFINNRNFKIYSTGIEQEFNSTINRSWNTGVSFSYILKEDRQDEVNPAEASIVKFRSTNRLFVLRKIQANASLEFRRVSIDNDVNAVSSFELSEGTGRGSNVLWMINGNYRVSNLIRLNFVYDGRTVRDKPSIHVVRLTVKAIF